MKKKFWKWVKDSAAKKNILRLDGLIDDWKIDSEDSLTTPQEFRAELDACKGDIELFINSPGGNVFAAAEIFSMLKEYRGGRITAKIPAFCASAATIIAMSAATVEISPLAFMVIHDPFVDCFGTEKDLMEGAKFLRDLKANIIEIYRQKTGLSRDKISDLMDAETYMNAEKAVELHFADRLMFEEKTAAQMYSASRNEPLLFKIYRASSSEAKSIRKDPRRRLIVGCNYEWRKSDEV